MKKLLSIIVLGLLLSVNAYAADKNIYLSCKSIVFKNGNEGAFATKKNLEVGSYVGHFFYKFKDKKKTTTVTVYEQGNTITEDWSNMKPKQASKSKFDYDKDKVIYTGGGTDPSGLTFGWAIQKKNNSYHHTHVYKYPKLDFDMVMDSKCKIVDKSKFNLLKKNGIN